MAKSIQYFWSSWPPASQQQFFKYTLSGLSLLIFFVCIGIFLFIGPLTQQIAQSKERYAQVVPIVQDIKTLRAQQGDLAHLPVDKAVWRLVDDLQIEKNLASLRASRLNEDEPGIQATFSGLSLTELTNFLDALRVRASLQTPECVLTRNPDDPRLADAHFVLAR
jgi:hypothetical protein